MAIQWHDVSIPLREGLTVWPGDPAFAKSPPDRRQEYVFATAHPSPGSTLRNFSMRKRWADLIASRSLQRWRRAKPGRWRAFQSARNRIQHELPF